jgi:hypothetical protein
MGVHVLRLDQVIGLLEEVTRTDLEACEAAIRVTDQAAAISAIELAFAKLDLALDLLRAQSS